MLFTLFSDVFPVPDKFTVHVLGLGMRKHFKRETHSVDQEEMN